MSRTYIYIYIYIYMHSKGDSIPGLEGACDHIRPPLIRKGNRRKGRFKGHKTFVSLDDARAATRNGILRSPANAGFRIEFEIRGLDFMVAGCQTRLKYRVRKTYTARNRERKRERGGEREREREGRKSFALKSKSPLPRNGPRGSLSVYSFTHQPPLCIESARCGGSKTVQFHFRFPTRPAGLRYERDRSWPLIGPRFFYSEKSMSLTGRLGDRVPLYRT